MTGESGGELGASMLGVAMLDGTPGAFALEVITGSIASVAADLVLEFVASAQSAGIGGSALEALQSFIAQADANAVGAVDLDALQAFVASQIGAAGVAGMSLDAWLQMLHQAAELASESMQLVTDGRTIVIENESRTVMVEADWTTDAVMNDRQAVTL